MYLLHEFSKVFMIVVHFSHMLQFRNMVDAGCFEIIPRPSWEQLYNKIHAAKKLLNKNPPMMDTFQMRRVIEEHLNVPDDSEEAYIPFYEIQDEDASKLRFTVVFSSTTCLAR